MARNSLLCADVPLRNYSLTHLLFLVALCQHCNKAIIIIIIIIRHTEQQ